MMVLIAVSGTALIAIGSNLIVPVGNAIGGVCDLAGIVSMMVFLGLTDGQ
jgi:hypothetical protein